MSRGGPFDGRAVITGAGKSQVGRRLGRTGLDLTVEACLRAIADAGLSAPRTERHTTKAANPSRRSPTSDSSIAISSPCGSRRDA